MKERSSLKGLAMASSTRRPACVSQDGSYCSISSKLTGMTSRPIPSPGMRPILSDLEAIDILTSCGLKS